MFVDDFSSFFSASLLSFLDDDGSEFNLEKNDGHIKIPPILLPVDSLVLFVLAAEDDDSSARFLPLILLGFVFTFNVVNEKCGDAGEHMRCVLVVSSLEEEEECFKDKTRIEHTLTLYSVFGVRSLRRW